MNARLLPGVVGLALGFLAGIVVGGLRPQEEVRRLEAEIERGAGASPDELAGPMGDLLRGALRSPGTSPDPEAATGEPPPRVATPGPGGVVAEEVVGPDATASPFDAGSKKGLEETKTLLAMRKAAALDALRQESNASPEQMDAIEAAIDVMNGELVAAMMEVLEEARADGREPPRRVMLNAMANASNALLDADEAIVSALETSQIAALSEASRDPLAWIDPSVLDVISSLEDAGIQ